MSKETKFIYSTQINNQIIYAKISIDNILNSSGVSAQLIFSNIESLLCACGNLSKLFIPIKNKPEREKNLISDFNISKDCFIKKFPIISDRNVRDSFEHFDERIDYFIKNHDSKNKDFADCNIGTITNDGSTSAGFCNPNSVYMRHYDNENKIISVVKRNSFDTIAINIEKLQEELLELEKLCPLW